MALFFPGTVGLQYPAPTPNFRFDASFEDSFPSGLAAGQFIVSMWVRPHDVSFNQELFVVADGGVYPAFYAVYFVIRLEGDIAPGTITVIMQSTLFAFCMVRRSDPGALVTDVWQHVLIRFATNGGTAHIYVDGVEVTYAFQRTETLLAPVGGSYVMLGSTYRGHQGGSTLAAGIRTISGDPGNGDPAKQFTTSAGDFYLGDMQCVGMWHSGVINAEPADFVEMLAAGYSPLFLNHRLEGSTATHGLIMSLPLIGENFDEEADPLTGIVPVLTQTGVGGATLTYTDGPGICEPADPDDPGPGVPLPERPRLCLPFGMPRSEIYTNPGNPADILPIVYGDFQVAGNRGSVPAVLIDQGPENEGPWVYCAAFHPVISIDDVYIAEIKQVPLATDPVFGYTIALSNNFQNQGTIATITFLVQPQDQVTWRGQGHYAADGLTLMENCIDQMVHLLTVFGNFNIPEDFDMGALAEATATVTLLDYRTAFVVNNEDVTQEWLTGMLFNVMGYWRINGREQIEIHVDNGGLIPLSEVTAHLVASRDCLNGDDGIAFILDRAWLVNDLTLDYCWIYSIGMASHRITDVRDEVSRNAYGPMKKVVTLIGLRRPQDVLVWGAILLARQSGRTRMEGAHIQMEVFAQRVAHITIGDYIGVSWPYGPTREHGNPFVNEIFRVVDLILDAQRGGGVTLIGVGLGQYITGPGDTRALEPWPA
jgi:hypothetical protein